MPKQQEVAEFGDFCLFCGNAASGAYCSVDCEAQDGSEEAPALISNQDSSSGSVCSTPPSSNPVSPFFGATHPSDGKIAKLDLTRSNKLNFDYEYSFEDEDNSAYARSYPSALHHPSSEATISFPDLQSSMKSKNRRPSSIVSVQLVDPPSDVLRFKRTPAQMPSAPRRLSSNLLSPVLKPLTPSPALKPLEKIQITPTKARQAACGRPGCPSLLKSPIPTDDSPASTSMARRASAPLTQRLRYHHERAMGDSSDEESGEAVLVTAERKRGRSREPKTAASTTAQKHNSTSTNPVVGKQRAESAHLLQAAEAPICTKPDECLATIKARPTNTASDSRSRPLRYLFGRGNGSQEPADDLDSAVSGLDLGSPQSKDYDSAILSSSSEEEKTCVLPRKVAPSDERGRTQVRRVSGFKESETRSKSPHRESRRSRSRTAVARLTQLAQPIR